MKRELMPLVLFLASILIFGLLSVFGIIFNLIGSFIKLFQVRFWRGIIHFIKYWLHILYQLWNAVKYILLHMAIGNDLIGNATGGKMIERLVTDERDTLYGKGNVTVSAATGKLEVKGKLNKDGTCLTWLLSKVLGAHHSVNAWLSELNKN